MFVCRKNRDSGNLVIKSITGIGLFLPHISNKFRDISMSLK